MIRKVKYCLLFVAVLSLLFSLFGTFVCAEGKSEADRLIDEYEKTLPDEYKELSDADGVISTLGFDALMSEAVNSLLGNRGRIVSLLFTLFGLCILCAVGRVIEVENSELIRCSLGAVASAVLFGELYTIIGEVSDSLSEISAFFTSVFPVLAASVMSSGGTSAASGALVFMNLIMEVCSAFTEKFLLVLCFALFMSGIASAFAEGAHPLFSGIKSAFIKGLGLLTAVLMGAISLQTLICSCSDGVAMRAARYAATNMIPIVGGTVSSSMSTLISGLAYSKGVIGGGAIAVIASMLLSPLITLLLYKLCFFLAIGFLDFAGASSVSRPICALRDALDALISVYAVCALIFIFQIVLLLKCEVVW